MLEPENDETFYGVPALVVSEIGGDKGGGATITAPERTPVPDSPLTGANPDYTYDPNRPPPGSVTVFTSTVTGPTGTYTTVITSTGPASNNGGGGGSSGGNERPVSTGVIVGATVGGVALAVALLLFVLYMWYKRRVNQLHKQYEDQRTMQQLIGPNGRPTSMSTYTGGMPAQSRDNLMDGVEPTFWGMLLQPRRSLRVVNK